MNVIRRQLASPAMLVACAALIVALGGVSYAAGVLPTNSVGTAQLKQQAVSRAKLKKNAVTGAKVANGTLLAADFKAGQLPVGLQGPKGDPGPHGPKGDTGAAGTARAYAVVTPQAPALVAARTKGFTGVRRPQTGVYCLTPEAGIDWETNPAVVSAEWNNSGALDVKAFPEATKNWPCNAKEYAVVTVHGTPPNMSNIVAFTVMVP